MSVLTVSERRLLREKFSCLLSVSRVSAVLRFGGFVWLWGPSLRFVPPAVAMEEDSRVPRYPPGAGASSYNLRSRVSVSPVGAAIAASTSSTTAPYRQYLKLKG